MDNEFDKLIEIDENITRLRGKKKELHQLIKQSCVKDQDQAATWGEIGKVQYEIDKLQAQRREICGEVLLLGRR